MRSVAPRVFLLVSSVLLVACAPAPTPAPTAPEPESQPDMAVLFPAEIEVTPAEGSTALEDWRPEPASLLPAVMVRAMDASGQTIDAPVDQAHLELCYREALGRNGEAGGSVIVYVPDTKHGTGRASPRSSDVDDQQLERCVLREALVLHRAGDPTRVLAVSFRSDVAGPDEIRGAEVAGFPDIEQPMAAPSEPSSP